MPTQTVVLVLFLVAALAVATVFLWVKATSRQSGAATNPEKVRGWVFIGLLVVVALFTAGTVVRMPYFLYADEPPARVVHVVARQFAFALSERPIESDADYAAALGQTIELPAGQVVEFRVTSFDVNHGFALYDPSGRIVAQVQAMPGYINRLRWRFERAGQYLAQCLEYCGAAHAGMHARFVVK